MTKRKSAPKPKNETEASAKRIALAFERKRITNILGPDAVSRIREVEGCGYEIVAPDGRNIEVKGSRGKKINGGFVLNSKLEADHLRNGGYIYRVIDVDGDPQIHLLTEADLNLKERYRADVRVKGDSKHTVVDGKTFQDLTTDSTRTRRKRRAG
jgi:hypothetical protein